MRYAATLAFAAIALSAGTALAQDGPIPKPDINGSYLFWTPAEQLVGYRNMEKVFRTNTVARGYRVSALPQGEPLKVMYQAEGQTYDVRRFMEKTNAGGVIVLHKGKVVMEEYALGYGPGQRWTSFSVGKSMSSTLAGAALRDGYIKSLDDLVTRYVPGLKGSAYDGVTVRQLLQMTSGVKWNEDYADPNSDVGLIRTEKSVNGSDPMVTFMSRRPREAQPGSKFVYKTGETHLVGAVVRAATGKTLSEYLSEKVWRPYGMEMDAVWMLDDAGHEYAGCCVSATLRDFARFGQFFMDGAKVDGQLVVPADWVKAATTTSPAAKRTDGSGYGYQWWVSKPPVYQAQGIFGQTIRINPEKELIIVVQSANRTASDREAGAARTAFLNAVDAAIPR